MYSTFVVCEGILAASIFITQAHAASLQVAPILLEFSPQEKVKELWLTNTGNESIRATSKGERLDTKQSTRYFNKLQRFNC